MLQADSGQLYSSAMQGLSSYANNIMGHTMNQYAAQSSLLSTQVVQMSHFVFAQSNPYLYAPLIADIAGEQQHLEDGGRELPKLRRNPTTNTDPWHEQWSDCCR